ncbi:Putative uncharacterized protein [Moritella viscosa]|uniref:hypothetical protein n=1 Tax=Moritella viscosa TaxID=80854 RepID=UPI00091F1DF2|nr:hypothetical protein [Moritella viscosa]SGY85454.1 Putative uncharacterized protein [Moritella viscosa]
MKYIKILIISSILFLTACADSADVTSGIGVDITPIHYSLSLNVNKSKSLDAKNRLDSFLVEQKDNILFGHIEMYVSNNTAYKFAKKVESKLHAQGIEAYMISIARVKQPIKQRFDYVIRVTRHQVTVPICRPAQLGDFNHNQLGCTIDSMRWQLMSNPENMLNQFEMDTRPSKAL